ncbi:DUF3102 domain-containing protein [Agrobacterium tumefaciens]|uniref:DUF3102 domain-containing protein n=1 Tax=Agrobacterium tumefaciens TaxID=358 RepID=UPI003BA21BEA
MSNHLPVLAQMANDAHEAAAVALRSAAQSAREAGAALNEAKTLVPHGEWESWLKANFKGGARTAQRYMRVAKRWPEIMAKTKRMSDLSVNEALRVLEARDELEEALALKAEADAVCHELDVLAAAVDTAQLAGLQFIIRRSAELHDLAVDIRSRSIVESARLAKELEAAR